MVFAVSSFTQLCLHMHNHAGHDARTTGEALRQAMLPSNVEVAVNLICSRFFCRIFATCSHRMRIKFALATRRLSIGDSSLQSPSPLNLLSPHIASHPFLHRSFPTQSLCQYHNRFFLQSVSHFEFDDSS